MSTGFPMGSFVAGFMLGVVFAGAWAVGSDFIPSSLSSPTSATSKGDVPESGAVSVADQSAGQEVIIESVTVPPPGVWIAVRELNAGELGNVLGAVHVNGPRSAVSVSLLRATEPGLPYAVELYRNDANGAFNLATNSVYIDFATGAPVIARFTTSR